MEEMVLFFCYFLNFFFLEHFLRKRFLRKKGETPWGVISVHYLSVQFLFYFLDDLTCRVYNFFCCRYVVFLEKKWVMQIRNDRSANPDVRVGINSSGTEWSVEKGATMGFERSPLYSTV